MIARSSEERLLSLRERSVGSATNRHCVSASSKASKRAEDARSRQCSFYTRRGSVRKHFEASCSHSLLIFLRTLNLCKDASICIVFYVNMNFLVCF